MAGKRNSISCIRTLGLVMFSLLVCGLSPAWVGSWWMFNEKMGEQLSFPFAGRGGNGDHKKLQTTVPNVSGNRCTTSSLAIVAGLLLTVIVGGSPAFAKIDVRNVRPVVLPIPDENPFIRKLQEKSWKLQPVSRARQFLDAMRKRLVIQQQVSLFNPKYFVHWAPDSTKYDILDHNSYTTALKLGKIQPDTVMSNPREELAVFVYTKPEDQQWVAENVGVFDLVQIPDELQATIEEIKRTPFPKYVPVSKSETDHVATATPI